MKIIKRQGQASLIEFIDENGRLSRVVVPQGKENDPDVLEEGIPYGIPWEDIFFPQTTPQIVADELRRRGIWTIEDLQANRSAALGAIQTAYGQDLAALMIAAKDYTGGKE